MARMEHSDNALTAPEVAQMLQVNRNTVYALAKEGKIASYTVGRKLRFTLDDVQAYIASQKSGGSAPSPRAAKDKQVPVVEPAAPTPRDAIVIAGQDLMLDTMANYLMQMGLPVARSYANSYQSLVDLYQGRAHIAGVHLWDGETDTWNLPHVKRLLPGTSCMVVHFARRSQGFVVRQGNPLGFRRWSDLIRPGFLLANREKGAGARVLLDEHVKLLEMVPSTIEGYQRELTSELAVATFVAQGLADVGVAGERVFHRVPGLDYLPLVQETLDVVAVKSPATKRALKALRDLLRNPGFRSEFDSLVGVDTAKMGAVTYEC